MGYVVIGLLVFFGLVLKDILTTMEEIDTTSRETFEPLAESQNEVTVGDMVLHDMVNENDTYDIGVIDFND